MVNFTIVSKHDQKADFSGLCKKKNWGFVLAGNVSYGYASKKQATEAAKNAAQWRG
jgi:hypothetical protein